MDVSGLFFQGWLGRLSDWSLTIHWTSHISAMALIKAGRSFWLCGNRRWRPVCVATLKAFFSRIKFGQCIGIGFLPSPPCPGQLVQGSRAWQIQFGLGTYQKCPPSLEILSFTWTAVERVGVICAEDEENWKERGSWEVQLWAHIQNYSTGGGWNDRNDKGAELVSLCCQGAEGQSPCLSLKLHRSEEPRIPLTLRCGIAVQGQRGGSRGGTSLCYTFKAEVAPCPLWLGRGVCSDSSQHCSEHSVHHRSWHPKAPGCH